MSRTRRLTRKTLSILIALMMAISLMAIPAAVAAERETLAAWNATTAGAGAVTEFAATSGAAGFAGNKLTLRTAAGTGSFTKAVAAVGGVPASAEASGSSWAAWSQTVTADMYWRLELLTKGYKNVELTFHGYGTATSPANWEAKYSKDGTTYQSFVPAKIYTVDTSNTPAAATPITVDLSVLDDADGPVYVGLFAQTAATNATGNNRFCNIKVTGVDTGGGGDPVDPPDPDVIPISEARAKTTGSTVVVEGTVTRAIQSSATNLTNCTLYIQDNTGGIAVYVSGITLSTFEVGAKVKVTGIIGLYTGVVQIQPANVAAIVALPDAPAARSPENITVAQLNSLAYEGKLVKIEGVKLTALATNSNHTITDTVSSLSATLRCTENTTLPGFQQDDIIEVVGVAANYNGTAQLMVSKVSDVAPYSETGNDSVAKANATPAGQTVTIKGQVTYLYANNSMMVQAGTGENDGICVFMSGANFSSYIGKVVEVTGLRTDYRGLKEVVPASIDNVIITTEPAFISEPTEITVAELVAGKYIGSWVVVKDVQLTDRNALTTAQNHTISQAGASVTLRAALSSAISQGDWLTIAGCGYMFDAPQLFALESGITPGAAPQEPGETETVAEWISPTVTDIITATGGECADASTLRIVGTTSTVLNWANAAINRAGGFDNKAGTAYWLFATNGGDYKNVNVSFSMRSSATGPRDFKVQYSADGENWFDAINPGIVVPSALGINDPASQFSRALPAGADRIETLYIRLVLDTLTSANGGTVAAGGTNSINNIVITGEYVMAVNELLRPQTDTPSGEVPVGKVITFSPAARDVEVDGYSVLVSTDGATWNAAADNKFTLAALPATISVKATAPGMVDSRVSSYSFTPAKMPMVTPSKGSGAVIPGATIKLECAVYGATILYRINGGAEQTYVDALILDDALFVGDPATLTVEARAVMAGYIDGDSVTFSYTKAVTGGEKVYFGQIHSHTNMSDGAGEVESAYEYAKNVAKLDFFAVTDHSNSLDTANSVDPATINLNTHNSDNAKWLRGQAAAAGVYEDGKFISFFGYEMTWSGGPGHINTFNTGGFVSRNNTFLNAKTNDAGMRAYYELLKRHPESISMFNHPGNTFGNFANFGYYDPVIDQRITLLEVGNGEGAIGSGGYFPSYEQYTLALDKGWHLAPTNSQDNHLGKWGDSNTARTAIWTNDLSLGGVYQALREMRVYATEVADLEIVYKVNGQPLGSILDVVPPSANFTAEITNPTDGNYVKSVALVTNGGREILRRTPNTQNTVYDETIAGPAPGYYYLRVVVSTPAGDRTAVTAPVWLGQGKAAGFSEVTKDKIMPVTEEPLTLTSTLFNNEPQTATLISITYAAGGETLISKTGLSAPIAPNSEITDIFTYTPAVAGETTVIVAAEVRFADGVVETYTFAITFDIWDANGLVYFGIDGSHYNEYVSGNYKDNMVNFTDVASSYGVRVNILDTEADLIAAANDPQYRALLLTVPSRRLYPNIPGNAAGLPSYRNYSQDVIDAVAAFAQRGGTTVLTGWSNIYEGGYTDTYGTLAGMPYDELMSAQQNKILAAIGSTLRIAQDGAADSLDPYWPGQPNAPNRLFPSGVHNAYNFDNPLLNTVDAAQRFSQYGGTTIFAVAPADKGAWNAPSSAVLPDSVSKVISLPAGCRSEDYDIVHPTSAGYPRAAAQMYDGQYMIMASETVAHAGGGSSQVVVAGGAFMSNFEIRNASVDNISDLYSNQNIVINLIQSIMEITKIADVKDMPQGAIVTVEGIATTNVYSGDSASNTGFFDCIYMQDEDGNGINLFPVATGVVEGQKIRVTGTVSSYQGEIQIAVRKLQVIDASINKVEPAQVTTAAAMAPANTGKLLGLSGLVSNVLRTDDGAVSQFIITDDSGVGALIYINAYITTAVDLSFVKNGALVSVTGLGSIGENASGSPLPRIRVRDCGEIALMQPLVYLVSKTPSASVNKLNGNMNELTVKVTELYSDGSKEVYTLTLMIKNNAADTYVVGPYKVYVDTKGNTQIRECRIVG